MNNSGKRSALMTKKVIIMGAAGRDFHNFNTNFRDNSDYEVVAFTATQIPNIEGRVYPSELAGGLYPNGIPIEDESELEALISKYGVNEVVFSYSDVPYSYVMNRSSIVNNAGASFRLMGLAETWVESTKPVVSICAIRTGCGKSQTTRRVAEILIERGKKVVAIRHPMPYGDLVKQRVQRFATLADLDLHECTIRPFCVKRKKRPMSYFGTAEITISPSINLTSTSLCSTHTALDTKQVIIQVRSI
jgi:predicted GTPase